MGNACKCVCRQVDEDEAADALLNSIEPQQQQQQQQQQQRRRHHHSSRPRGPPPPYQVEAPLYGLSEEQRVQLVQRVTMIHSLPLGRYDVAEQDKKKKEDLPDSEEVQGSEKKGEADRECPICMVDFTVGEPIRLLPCMHFYHMRCIDEWLMRSYCCPSCMERVDVGMVNTLTSSAPARLGLRRRRRGRGRGGSSSSVASLVSVGSTGGGGGAVGGGVAADEEAAKQRGGSDQFVSIGDTHDAEIEKWNSGRGSSGRPDPFPGQTLLLPSPPGSGHTASSSSSSRRPHSEWSGFTGHMSYLTDHSLPSPPAGQLSPAAGQSPSHSRPPPHPMSPSGQQQVAAAASSGSGRGGFYGCGGTSGYNLEFHPPTTNHITFSPDASSSSSSSSFRRGQGAKAVSMLSPTAAAMQGGMTTPTPPAELPFSPPVFEYHFEFPSTD